MKKRWMLVLAAILALSLVAVACGDDDDEESEEAATAETATTAGPAEIEVTAGEYFFELSETPESPGPVTVRMTDEGGEAHSLIFARINEGFTLDEAFKAEGEKGTAETLGQLNAAPGQQAKGEIKAELTPGTYAMVCPVTTKDGESHYDLGQSVEFDIE
jgi:plastocyanin